jgi:BMFP domain-containing protein YqiC
MQAISENAMQTKNKILDDLSQIMTSAMGVAQGAKDEASNAMKSMMDRWLADRNLVTREEFEALTARLDGLVAENATLRDKIKALETRVG